MKSPKLPFLLLLILIAACASGSGGNSTDSGTSAGRESGEPAKVSSIDGQWVKLEWRNLNPKYGDTRYGLINRSSPEKTLMAQQYRKYPHFKPASDEDIMLLLEGIRTSGFYDFATRGATVDSFEMGDGHHVFSLTLGDESWALISSRGSNALNPEVATIARDLKLAVMNVYNRTLYLQPVDADERIFRVEPHKYRR